VVVLVSQVETRPKREIEGGYAMPTMGRYCKAYLVGKFREYGDWSENRPNVRPRKENVDGKEVDVDRDLVDSDILYLQENLIVTDGIFLDENVIFDNVAPEWREFCTAVLDFQVPEDRSTNEVATLEQSAVASATA
jgi:hypothetical protein